MEKNLKLRKEKRKNQKGITLIALVITIVILIILATVAINAVFKDGGLIDQAELAKDLYNNSAKQEEESMSNLEHQLNGLWSGSDTEEPFEPGPTEEPEGGGTEMTDMTNGIIEIKWLDGTSYNVSNTPNAPVTKTISNGTMELVKFDSSSKTWKVGTEYSYTAGTGSNDNTQSKWANARVTIDGVDSYFVWIPRYAYRIIYFDSSESKKAYQEGTLTEADAVAQGKIIGYSDSRGIVDAQGKKIADVASTTKTRVSEDYFMVHPAFINDVDAGGWDSELPGIWVGKYETSSVEGNGNSLTADNVTTKTPKVQLGVNSWRYIQIGNMYTVSYNYARDLESHLLKNSEWGAVAYLTESKYGRNGIEIAQNTNSSYYTGGGSGTAYITNVSQSSTGNVYGIYDLSGGAYEYVAGYYKDGILANGSSFADGVNDKYATAYTGTTASAAYKYGDATYETKSWHSDLASFVDSGFPFFKRGGHYNSSSANAGVFCFDSYNRSQQRQRLISPCPSSVMCNLSSEQRKKFTTTL